MESPPEEKGPPAGVADAGGGGSSSVHESGNVSAFIPAALDDLGLTASEFRVACRIARRGRCTESVPNMAAGCRLHPDTVQACLKNLVRLGVISKTERAGASSIYAMTATAEWPSTPPGKEYPPETEGDKGVL
jgi:hypothetical protein